MKISIGTANFGQRYGVNRSILQYDDINVILKYASERNILGIDTAEAYGDAQLLIGKFLKKNGLQNRFEITSKLSPNIENDSKINNISAHIEKKLDNTLKQLSVECLECYMIHDTKSIYNQNIMDGFLKLKKKGKTRHLGVSVYEPEEVLEILKMPEIDCIELPYNVLDHRMKDVIHLSHEKRIYARSIFLQGVIMRDASDLPEGLEGLKSYITKIEELCRKYNITREELAIGYVQDNAEIDYTVVGVDSLTQIKRFYECMKMKLENAIVENVEHNFSNIRKELIVPTYWRK